MKQRGTVHYMNPTLYALYILKLQYNLGPKQILEAWKDYTHLEITCYTREIPHFMIKDLIERALTKFWSLNQIKPITNARYILKFAKRYSKSWVTRWFYRVNWPYK